MKPQEYTANEIQGINQGLMFLASLPIDEFGVSNAWDTVTNVKLVKDAVETISEISEKINKEYYVKDEKEGYKLIEGKEDAFVASKKELEKKTFAINLIHYKAKDLEALVKNENLKKKDLSFKTIHFIQLQPIIKR